MTYSRWLQSLEEALGGAGYRNPKLLVKKHLKSFTFFYTEGLDPQKVVEDFLEDILESKRQEYVEKLRTKRQTTSHSDSVMYKGKLMKRCPKGTSKSGNSCAPAAPQLPTLSKYNMKDLGGVRRQQIEKLSKAKSREDVLKARKFK